MSESYRNYCVFVFGPQGNFVELVKEIADGEFEILSNGEFLSITAMSTSAKLNNIEATFRENNISFGMFEMDPKVARAYTVNDVMNERLFDKFFYSNYEEVKDEGTYIEFSDVVEDEGLQEVYLKGLLEDLNKAISEENFEQAVKLRDEIRLIDLDFYKKHVEEGPNN